MLKSAIAKTSVLLGIAFPFSLFAETDLPDVVVTASKQETPAGEVASTVQVISQDQIVKSRATNVPEVLRSVAGMSVTEVGSPGDDVDVRLRGADRDEVLVLIDGVPVNDVRERRAGFLGVLPIQNVEKIEIVSGSQSVLYGSDAVGGVINVITKRGKEGHHASVFFEGGNLQTFREGVAGWGGGEKYRYSASVSRTDQKGRFDRDRYGGLDVGVNFGYDVTPQFKVDVGTQYLHNTQQLYYEFETGFDPAILSIIAQIDPDTNSSLTRDIMVNHLNLKGLPTSWWTTELTYSFFLDLEHLQNSAFGDVAAPGFLVNSQDFKGNGKRNTVDLKNFFDVYHSDFFSTDTTLGFEFQDERFKFTDPPISFPAPGQEGDRQNYAPYLQQRFKLFNERLIATAGVRFDHNTTFGNEFSPSASLMYRIPKIGTTIRGNYSEGFHGPTVLEFFNETLLKITADPAFNAVRLKSELSQSYDIGIDQEIGKWAKLGATFFYIDYDRLFDGLEFMSDAYSTGVEFKAEVRPMEKVKLGGNYTFLKTKNEDKNKPLSDRPQNSGNIFAEVQPFAPLTLRSDVFIFGKRRISDTISTVAGDLGVIFVDPNGNTSAGGSLKGYVRVDLSASYQILKDRNVIRDLTGYFKVKNLLDRSYQEKFGFPEPGITFLAGAKAEF